MKKTHLLAVGAALQLVACFSSSVSPDVVRTKAASDMSCKTKDVTVEQINDGNWKATGCNQSVTYVCSGSNFMSSGMCMREGAVPTSASMQK
ncbi:MAG TPA: hypothetical protein VM925_20675 [Labilithrix sp.]|nr:hypothetical protein [Labilithrix sp.]